MQKMKKLHAFFATSLAISALVVAPVFAQTTKDKDYEDAMSIFDNTASAETNTFGFKNTDVIQVTKTTDDSITIAGPVVYDKEKPIINYDITLSEKPYESLSSMEKKKARTEECGFTTVALEGKKEFECTIDTKKMDKNKTYHVTIFPKKGINLGTNSKDITINHSELMKKNTKNTNTTHNTAAKDFCATENISHEQKNDKVTVKWKAGTNANSVRIDVRGGNSKNEFKNVGKTDAKKEQFTFTPSQSGTYLVKLTPLDKNNKAGKSCTYTVPVSDFEVKTVKTHTGPRETLMIIGLIAVIAGYFILRKRH